MKATSVAWAVSAVLFCTAHAAGVPKTCTDYDIPVTITSPNFGFPINRFKTDFDVADFLDTLTSRNKNVSFSVITLPGTTVTKTYTISATFCRPGHAPPDPAEDYTVIIATHGLNFDRRYWDPELDKKKYSFVEWALSQNYSIFYYDRLGVGKSEQVSGYVAQLPNQVAILTELVKLVKSGIYVGKTGKPTHTVLLGHSFGSALSMQALGLNHNLVDGLVLTGFSSNGTYVNPFGFATAIAPRIAAQQQPGKWRQLDTGYLTGADLFTSVAAFFKAPYYDVTVARYADDHKFPFAVGELITTNAVSKYPFNFTGAALILTGKYDLIYCTSDCDGGVLVNPIKDVFTRTRSFKTVSFPKAGHALNLHLNAASSFKVITDFLRKNGL
ncbi:Alpha/Beta hydrolase protein [Podospora australis]|uniref:Alpha/Beta hydrolase protein n=1 Tax=Podospora australis TaxID=1536484 RepID=A0AAN6WUI2_9PEZI|nr:Alpha/Beta hydrolase protein [Podospora australis]